MVKKGDTLVEVTLAIGIFSMIAIAVASVMGGGTAGAEAGRCLEEIRTAFAGGLGGEGDLRLGEQAPAQAVHVGLARLVEAHTEAGFPRADVEVEAQVRAVAAVGVLRAAHLEPHVVPVGGFVPGIPQVPVDAGHHAVGPQLHFVVDFRHHAVERGGQLQTGPAHGAQVPVVVVVKELGVVVELDGHEEFKGRIRKAL